MIENVRPFFSVCVPVYNVQEYLSDCLESLAQQSFSDFEIILVDDGATDSSGTLCDKFKESYSGQCTVIHKQNEGLLMARRTAIQAAKGEFLMFLDSDDMYRSDALDVVNRKIRTYSADLVIFNASVTSDYKEPFRELPFEADRVFVGAEKIPFLKTICGTSLINNMWMKAVSRKIVDIDRDYSPLAHVRMGEDLVQSLPLVDQATRVVYCKEPLYFYRLNPTSISHSFDSKSFFRQVAVMQELFRYAEHWDVLYDKTEKRYLALAHTVGANVCADSIMSVLLSNTSWNEKKKIIGEIKATDLFVTCANACSKKMFKQSLVMFCAKKNCILLLQWLANIRKYMRKFMDNKP